jgi:hypothetical protein
MFGSSAASMKLANAVSREECSERSSPGWERWFGSQLIERQP